MQNNKINKIIIIIIAVTVAIIIILALSINYIVKKQIRSYIEGEQLLNNHLQEQDLPTPIDSNGLEELKTKEEKYKQVIENAPPGAFKEVVFSVCGKITEINLKEIILHANFYPASPIENLEMAGKAERKVVLTNNTQIVEQIEKSLEEQGEYQEIDTGTLSDLDLEMNFITPPEFFKEASIPLSEIEVDDEICVVTNENIKDKNEFFAQKIILRFFPK